MACHLVVEGACHGDVAPYSTKLTAPGGTGRCVVTVRDYFSSASCYAGRTAGFGHQGCICVRSEVPDAVVAFSFNLFELASVDKNKTELCATRCVITCFHVHVGRT